MILFLQFPPLLTSIHSYDELRNITFWKFYHGRENNDLRLSLTTHLMYATCVNLLFQVNLQLFQTHVFYGIYLPLSLLCGQSIYGELGTSLNCSGLIF